MARTQCSWVVRVCKEMIHLGVGGDKRKSLEIESRRLCLVAEDPRSTKRVGDDRPFIVLTETKFSSHCIPVWIGTLLTGLGSKKKKHM